MRIGIINYGTHPLPSNRGIDQLAQSLKYLGFEPYIMSRLNKSQERIAEFKGIPTFQLPPQTKGNYFSRDTSFPFPFNPFWLRWIKDSIRDLNWGAIFLRETPLSWEVLTAAKMLSIPVFLDMRENLTAMYRLNKKGNIFVRAIKQPSLVKFYEKMTINKFSHIFTVSEELKQWAATTYQIDSQKISVLENTPHEEFLGAAQEAIAINNSKNNDSKLKLVYAGNIHKEKGILNVISAMPYLISSFPEVHLRIIGDGNAIEDAKSMAHELNIAGHVEFFPMLSMRDLAFALSECHIGIESCPLHELTHQTIPGKLFEYMACGLAVISSPRKPVIRILNETGCGKIFYSSEPRQIAEEIGEIIGDRENVFEMSNRARSAVLQKYNWKSTLSNLKDVLNKFGVS